MPSLAQSLSALLASEHAVLLRRTTRIVGSLPAAEDVLQRLWLKVQEIEDVAVRNPRAYLFRLASNLAIDHRRAEATRQRVQAKAETYLWGPVGPVSAETGMIDRQALTRVLDALDALPDPGRTMFRLNRFEEKRIIDISAIYGVSTTTVENHLRRALAALRAAREDG